jgi:adenine deaminase
VPLAISERIRASLGSLPPDLVLTDARIANVFTGELLPGSIAIRGDTITAVGSLRSELADAAEVRQLDGRVVVPGYVDSHMHVGGSYVPVDVLAAALLERGTTTLATDMYELYAMGGLDGVVEGIELAEQAGLRILFMSPAHLIGLERLGTFAHPPSREEFLEMNGWERTAAVNEPPPFVVLRENEDVLAVVEDALRRRKIFEGHAVGIAGAELQAYASAGASSDHEAVDVDEARERLRLGYRVIMREGSAARDLGELAPLLLEYPGGARFAMVCTDELEPKHLLAEGHVDHKLRKLVRAGIDPMVALQTATINAAEYFGLADRIGSIAPGRSADLLVLEELETFRPSLVLARGAVVAEDGRYTGERREVREPGAVLRSRVVLRRPLEPGDFRLPYDTGAPAATARVIGVVDGSLVSEARSHECSVVDGIVLPDPENDVLRVAVVERHTGSGRIGRAFVSGLGLRDGAIAMTYCHVHQNLLVIGTSDEQMAEAAAAVTALGGGMAVVQGDRVVKTVALPVGGVLSSGALAGTAEEMREMEEAIRGLGNTFDSPILSIAFCALPTIPAYGLTDFGLYDVAGEQFVDVVVEVKH